MITEASLYDLYWNQNQTLRQIARSSAVHHTTVWRWVKKYNIKRKEASNKNNIKNWNAESLAYLLGVKLGDGNISLLQVKNNGGESWRFKVGTPNKKFRQEIIRNLRNLGLRAYEYGVEVCCHSKQLCNLLTSFAFGKDFLKTDKLKIQFIKGFYESEGNYELDQPGKSRGYFKKYARIRIYNTNKGLLEFANSLLSDLGFHFNLRISRKATQKRKTLYRLDNRKQKEVQTFMGMMKPRIKNAGGD